MLQTSLRQIDLCYEDYNEQSIIQDLIVQAAGIIKRNAKEKIEILYPTPLKYDRIEVEDKQIPIIIFEEARGRGWERALTIDRYAKNYYSISC